MTRGVRIDASACDGVGICTVVAPDLVALDEWGFPIAGEVTDRRLARQARRAARACPHRAVQLVEPPSGDR